MDGDEVFHYSSGSSPRVVAISTSAKGIFQATTDRTEPAWAFRLWKASLILAEYLDEHPQLIVDKLVLDLGAGTGLLSILSSQIGAKLSICTDQSFALPLILHNARANLHASQIHSFSAKEDQDKSSNNQSMKCNKGHCLSSSVTETDEYMCNVCEDEVPEDSTLYSCRICNFDCCSICAQNLSDPSRHHLLPSWIQYSLESDRSNEANNSMDNSISSFKNHFLACELDWNNEQDYSNILDDCKSLGFFPAESPLPLIIAADVTYSLQSTELFINCLHGIASYYSGSGLEGEELVVLLAHHRRAEETQALLFDKISSLGWRKELLRTVGEDTDTLDTNEVADERDRLQRRDLGQVLVLQLNIPLL
jgi:hypothetical protein